MSFGVFWKSEIAAKHRVSGCHTVWRLAYIQCKIQIYMEKTVSVDRETDYPREMSP